jgi:hypothetical protein
VSEALDLLRGEQPPTLPAAAEYVDQALREFVAALPVPSKRHRHQGERWRMVPWQGPLWKRFIAFRPYLSKQCRVVEQGKSRGAGLMIECPPELISEFPPVLNKSQGGQGGIYASEQGASHFPKTEAKRNYI